MSVKTYIIIGVVILLGVKPAAARVGDAPAATCTTQPSAHRDDSARDVTVLKDDLSPLRTAFNKHAEQWRVVSLVSPTCSECVLGAEAVEKEIAARYPASRVDAIVIWIPMLESDSEKAAFSSASIFPAARATQFYDSKKLVGWGYSRKTFVGFLDRAIKSLPKDDPLADGLREHNQTERPQWDLYMLYAPGANWEATTETPPLPTHWIRHCGRIDGKNSTYWRDSPDKPPHRGDLFAGMREMAEEALGKARTPDDAASAKCLLSEASLAERQKLLDGILRDVVERKQLTDGIALRFEPAKGLVSRLANAIELERECCQFIEFQIKIEKDNGPIWLELRGSGEGKKLIDQYFGPKRGPSDKKAPDPINPDRPTPP